MLRIKPATSTRLELAPHQKQIQTKVFPAAQFLCHSLKLAWFPSSRTDIRFRSDPVEDAATTLKGNSKGSSY